MPQHAGGMHAFLFGATPLCCCSLAQPCSTCSHTPPEQLLLALPLQVKCEERVGWVSYDQETTRFKMYVEQDGMLRDTTPQQFELDAGNHSRKWKSSFRLLGG